jgi:heme-degrading monooxygenase HmoA
VIIIIVHHWCKPGMFEAAQARIDANGDSSSQAPGFIFRYRISKPGEPERLSTVAAWESFDAYRSWKDARNAFDAEAKVESPYDRWVNEIFEVENIHSIPVSGIT